MKDVVIEVNKGMVTAIYSDATARFVVVDWDLRERLEPSETLGLELGPSSLKKMSREMLAQYNSAIQ